MPASSGLGECKEENAVLQIQAEQPNPQTENELNRSESWDIAHLIWAKSYNTKKFA